MTRIIREYPTLKQITTDPKDVSYLLSLANDMRRAKGDEILDDLPESEPQEVHACIIANAFNYGCEVHPRGEHLEDAYIEFTEREDLETYLKVMNITDWETWARKQTAMTDLYETCWWTRGPLNKELNSIAVDFDEGKRFVEYVVSDFDCKDSWLESVQENNSVLV